MYCFSLDIYNADKQNYMVLIIWFIKSNLI